MRHITKDIFLHTLFCPIYGWRLRHEKILRDYSPGDLFRMEQGKIVGAKARELYPGGIFANETEGVTGTGNGQRILFEVPFKSGSFVARADIVVRNGDTWDLIEVKSSSSSKPEFIDDMAYTALIAANSGFTPERILLMILDKNYRLGMEPQKLFQSLDLTSDVFEKVREFEERALEVEMITGARSEPDPVLKYNCKSCDQFSSCFPDVCDAHILCIPRISQGKIDQLLGRNITSLHDVPDSFSLTPKQVKFVHCVKSGKIAIDDALCGELEKISWPVSYLDFETMMTPIPLYPDTGPYEKIPTQYSIHILDREGGTLQHREYIASPFQDCRRELALRLLDDLGDRGSVVTYSGFERNIITGLKERFPDLSIPLQVVLGRIADLEKCIRCIQHPGFLGRTSIKVVGPVLVPDISYDPLEIADGDSAMVTFALAALGKIDETEWSKKKAALLEYCKLDTYAMVRLHEVVNKMANAGM
jgi:hypothetical protein